MSFGGHDAPAPLGAALACIAVGLALWLLWVLVARRRAAAGRQLGSAGPATIDLGDEPPAVVNLLLNELHCTGDAVAATVLDLAARRHVEVIQVAPGAHVVSVRERNRDDLLPYEARLLSVVRTAAQAAPAAPADIARALGPGSALAWYSFAVEVHADAIGRGLVVRRRSLPVGLLLVPVLVTCAGVAMLTPLVLVPAAPTFLVLLLGGGLAASLGASRGVLTDAGRAAGARWLGVRRSIAEDGTFDELPAGAVALWDRYLAYGAAMGLSGAAVHGVVDELRTHLSLADVRAGVREVRAARRRRDHADPQAEARARLRRWRTLGIAGGVLVFGVLIVLRATGVLHPTS